MTNYDLEAIMPRFPVLAEAALATVTNPETSAAQKCDAVEFWPYQQEAFPYWWHRIEDMTVEEDPAGDSEIHVYRITAALVIAHITEGYKYSGDTSAKAHRWISAYMNYMRAHRDLAIEGHDTYGEMPNWLWTADGGARVTGIPNGTRPIQNNGIGLTQVAAMFSIEMPLLFELY